VLWGIPFISQGGDIMANQQRDNQGQFKSKQGGQQNRQNQPQGQQRRGRQQDE
jgi:hypothetical protein